MVIQVRLQRSCNMMVGWGWLIAEKPCGVIGGGCCTVQSLGKTWHPPLGPFRAAQIRELLKMPVITKTRASLTAPVGVKRPAPAASVQPGAG